MANMWAFGSTEEIQISDTRGTLLRLGGYLAVHRGLLLFAAVAILVVSAISMIPPWLAKHVIDDVIPRPLGAGTRLLGLAAAMLAIHVARAVLTYANRYSIAWVGQRVIIQIGREMFGRLERMPLKYFEKQESGVTMSRMINDVNALQMALMGPTVNAIVGVVDMCIYVAILPMQMIAAAGTSVVLWYGPGQVMNHQMTVGELVAFMTSLIAFLQPIA